MKNVIKRAKLIEIVVIVVLQWRPKEAMLRKIVEDKHFFYLFFKLNLKTFQLNI